MPTLIRAIGRWSLAGLVLNSMIGTGVFVLPGTIAGQLGWASMYAWILAAALTGAMIFCFAEVASRFSEAGGAYLYAKAAFGPFVGIQMGWMVYFVRCITAAVQANLFTTYLAELWPGAAARPAEVAVTTAFIGLHALVNVRSVGSGAKVSNVFAVVKLLPLTAFGASRDRLASDGARSATRYRDRFDARRLAHGSAALDVRLRRLRVRANPARRGEERAPRRAVRVDHGDWCS